VRLKQLTDAGQPLTAEDKVTLGNIVGASNYWYDPVNQANWPVYGPPVPPSDPFADLKFRQTIGSWAAFQPQFFIESNALKQAYPDKVHTISQINNYYGPGGFGNVNGNRSGNQFFYRDIATGKLLPDINGACDLMILNQPGNPQHVAPPTWTW